MEQKNMSNLNATRAVYNVIGSICQDTELLKDSKTQLKPEDFMQSLHQTVFKAINNIVYNASGDNVSNITAVDVDNYLSAYPTQYKIWNDQKGFDYLLNCLEHANKETYWQSYDRIKKMSILRAYVNKGFDISELYDWESDDFLSREKSLQDLDKKDMKDIFEHFTLKNLQIKDSYDIETEGKQFKAGTNIKDLLDKFKAGIEYGAPYGNQFENFLFRGQRKGKVVIRSGASGTLKTSISISNMVNNAVSKVYKNGEWHYNGVSLPSLFISTELDEDELNVIALAYMTGIPRKVIMDGLFNKEQEKVLEEAGNILESSPLYMYHIPNFSVADIEDIIERNILDNDVGYISFDYIQLTSKLARSTSELFGQNQREDQILLHLSSSLKTLAEKYEVYIETGTQLNRNSKDEDNWDATSIRGGSSIIDKVDCAELLFRAKEKHLEKVKSIVEESGFGKAPNYFRIVFKNRAGMADVIIWSHMNPSTVREEVLFCTDLDYNIIEDVEKLSFEFKEGRTDKDLKQEEKYADDNNTKVFGDIDVKNDEEELDF